MVEEAWSGASLWRANQSYSFVCAFSIGILLVEKPSRKGVWVSHRISVGEAKSEVISRCGPSTPKASLIPTALMILAWIT